MTRYHLPLLECSTHILHFQLACLASRRKVDFETSVKLSGRCSIRVGMLGIVRNVLAVTQAVRFKPGLLGLALVDNLPKPLRYLLSFIS